MSYENEYYLVEVGYGFEANGERGFSRGNYIPIRTIHSFLKERNFSSVFCTAYRYNNTDLTKANLYGDLYLDFDDIKCFDNVKADAITALSFLKVIYHIDESQVKIFFSGNKGIHIIVPAELLGVEPMPLLNGVFKTIALSIKTFSKNKTIDTQIYDNKRMFRIPNTLHEKSGLYKIPISAQELRTLSEHEIKELAKQPRQMLYAPVIDINHTARQAFAKNVEEYYLIDKEARKNKKFKAKLTFTPPCIQYLIENGASEGQRNITIACLTSFYKNYGTSLDETIDIISEWNAKNSVPTGEMELKRTVRSIFLGDKSYGCSTLKLMSVCDTNKCKLSKRKEVISNAVKC